MLRVILEQDGSSSCPGRVALSYDKQEEDTRDVDHYLPVFNHFLSHLFWVPFSAIIPLPCSNLKGCESIKEICNGHWRSDCTFFLHSMYPIYHYFGSGVCFISLYVCYFDDYRSVSPLFFAASV